MVEHDQVRFLESCACFLIEAVFPRAGAPIAGGGICIDPFPDCRPRRRVQFLAEAGFCAVGPFDNAMKLILIRPGKKISFCCDSLAESARAEIIRFSEKENGFEIRETTEIRNCFKKFSAERKIVFQNLFLK